MRRSLAFSLLLHGAVLACAWVLVPDARTGARGRPLVLVCSEREVPAPVAEPEPPAQPRPPTPTHAPEEFPVVDEPEDFIEAPREPAPAPESAVRYIPVARLGRSLRPDPPAVTKRAPAAPSRAAAPARASPPAPGPRGRTRGPQLSMQPVTPPYPARALRRGLEGRVVLRLLVSKAGAVVRVEIDESSGHKTLDRAAAKAVLGWRFRPALENGAPVAAWHRCAIRFRLRP